MASSKKRASRRREADLSVLGEHPRLDYFGVMTYFRTRGGDEVPAAMEEFYTAVGTSPDTRASQQMQDELLASFVEWFVFEWRLENGQTPLEHYALAAPRRTPEERAQAEVLRQSAASQLFSLFWVRSADEAAHVVRLEDAVNGATFDVYDEDLAHEMAAPAGKGAPDAAGGTLVATRLVCVAGEWRCPIGALLVRRDMDEQGFSATLSELTDAGGTVDFLDAARLEYGDTRYLDEPAGGEGADGGQAAPQVVLDGPASEVPGMDVAPEERMASVAEAARLYGLLARDFALEPTWADVVGAVRTRGEGADAHDVMDALFHVSAGGTDVLDDAAFQDLTYCFLIAWNLLPHDELGGKSPAEVYQGA